MIVDENITDDEAYERLVAVGATPDPEAELVQFNNAERVISVSATAAVAAILSKHHWVRGIYPNSEMQPYGEF